MTMSRSRRSFHPSGVAERHRDDMRGGFYPEASLLRQGETLQSQGALLQGDIILDIVKILHINVLPLDSANEHDYTTFI